jgi:ABC-type amino acid transport substrate-binding protein
MYSRTMMKIFWSVLLAAVALVSTGCSKSGAGGAKKLVIATDATYPPFEIIDDKGEFSGVSIELGRALGKELGREVEFQNINFDGLIAALKSGSVDCIISSLTANEERRQSIDFSDPYVKTGLALLASVKSPVQSLEDLKAPGRRVVVRLGTTGETFVRKHLPQAQVLALDSDTACVLEVVQGGVDAWLYDQLSLMNYHERHPDTTRVLLKAVQEEVWAIGLRQGDEEFKGKTNAFLAKFRSEGGFTKLGEKHLAKEKGMMEAQGIPFVFEIGK